MHYCKRCGKAIPYRILVDGKWKKTDTRRYCFECSPYRATKDKYGDGTKTCTECGDTLPLSDFFQRGGNHGLHSRCKHCHAKYVHQNIIKKKLAAIAYLGGKCSICGYDKNHAALDFHHLGLEEKDEGISRMLFMSFEKLKPELDKCVLVCANCHRELHNPQSGKVTA